MVLILLLLLQMMMSWWWWYSYSCYIWNDVDWREDIHYSLAIEEWHNHFNHRYILRNHQSGTHILLRTRRTSKHCATTPPWCNNSFTKDQTPPSISFIYNLDNSSHTFEILHLTIVLLLSNLQPTIKWLSRSNKKHTKCK